MSEIPEDIRQTAKALRGKLCIDGVCQIDRGCGCLDDIATALLAERNAATERERARCRDRANKWADDLDGFRNKEPRNIMRNFASTLGTPDQTQPANPEDKT